jgi:hypothetical protein
LLLLGSVLLFVDRKGPPELAALFLAWVLPLSEEGTLSLKQSFYFFRRMSAWQMVS